MITQLYEYSSRISSSRAVFITLLFSLFFAVLLLSFLLGLRSVRPIQNLLQLFQNPEASLSHIYNDKEIRYIADQIAGYIQQNQTLTDELSARLNLLNQTKMLALQSQINPHFLFNTLNMLHIQECEALGYDHKIPKMTLSLSKLLRYAIESTDLVFLKTEIDFTRMYIDLLKERYNNKLNVIYDIEDSTLNAKVPKLFLQPLVENAVFHGLAEHMSENSTLTLSCCRNNAFIVVSVADNGIGMSPETLAHLREELKESVPLKNSIGIKNVVTRMNLLYGGDFSLEIDSLENQGTVFTLRFPILQ